MTVDVEEAVWGRVERTIKLYGALLVVGREQSICAKIMKKNSCKIVALKHCI